MTEQSDNVCVDLLTAWKTLSMAKVTGIVTNAATMEKKKRRTKTINNKENPKIKIGKVKVKYLYVYVCSNFFCRRLSANP